MWSKAVKMILVRRYILGDATKQYPKDHFHMITNWYSSQHSSPNSNKLKKYLTKVAITRLYYYSTLQIKITHQVSNKLHYSIYHSIQSRLRYTTTNTRLVPNCQTFIPRIPYITWQEQHYDHNSLRINKRKIAANYNFYTGSTHHSIAK